MGFEFPPVPAGDRWHFNMESGDLVSLEHGDVYVAHTDSAYPIEYRVSRKGTLYAVRTLVDADDFQCAAPTFKIEADSVILAYQFSDRYDVPTGVLGYMIDHGHAGLAANNGCHIAFRGGENRMRMMLSDGSKQFESYGLVGNIKGDNRIHTVLCILDMYNKICSWEMDGKKIPTQFQSGDLSAIGPICPTLPTALTGKNLRTNTYQGYSVQAAIAIGCVDWRPDDYPKGRMK